MPKITTFSCFLHFNQMNRLRKVLLFIFLGCIPLLSFGNDLSFSKLSVENGLSNNLVKAICKDLLPHSGSLLSPYPFGFPLEHKRKPSTQQYSVIDWKYIN